MKKFAKKIVPKFVWDFIKSCIYAIKFLPESLYWYYFTIKYSTLFECEKVNLAQLTITCHVLEKGITMPQRRLGFGYDRVRSIIKRCDECIKRYSENHVEIQSALNDLEQYLQLHEVEGFKLPFDIVDGIKKLMYYKREDTIECFESTPDDLFRATNNFRDFAYSRHTCRWYSNEEISPDILIKAITLAQTAPSACNRQSTRVYVIEMEEKKQKILQLQNGNRGFGHLANKLLLITSDMRCWDYNTRTSAYLDAGIFTMNLLYALHYYKICACTLNAHFKLKQRKQLQNIVGYADSEIPIVFISIGKAPDHFMIAGSQRKDIEQIYKFL